jgi:hypothetical protein
MDNLLPQSKQKIFLIQNIFFIYAIRLENEFTALLVFQARKEPLAAPDSIADFVLYKKNIVSL